MFQVPNTTHMFRCINCILWISQNPSKPKAVPHSFWFVSSQMRLGHVRRNSIIYIVYHTYAMGRERPRKIKTCESSLYVIRNINCFVNGVWDDVLSICVLQPQQLGHTIWINIIVNWSKSNTQQNSDGACMAEWKISNKDPHRVCVCVCATTNLIGIDWNFGFLDVA